MLEVRVGQAGKYRVHQGAGSAVLESGDRERRRKIGMKGERERGW
jgi:hypothetical protein